MDVRWLWMGLIWWELLRLVWVKCMHERFSCLGFCCEGCLSVLGADEGRDLIGVFCCCFCCCYCLCYCFFLLPLHTHSSMYMLGIYSHMFAYSRCLLFMLECMLLVGTVVKARTPFNRLHDVSTILAFGWKSPGMRVWG
jgi:hypothetical protein